MKTWLIKKLAGWLYGINADQWRNVMTWCAQLLRNQTMTGAEKRAEVGAA